MNAYDLSGVAVLMVESSRFMRKILGEMLAGLGVGPVTPVQSQTEAMEWLDGDSAIDVVLTELDLDGSDGIEFIRAIRAHEDQRVRMLPVVVVSSDTRLPRVVAARDTGATEFVAKPLSADALYRRLVQLIEHPRPFVQVGEEYFGPDRRRQVKEFMGDDRRLDDSPATLLSA